MELKKFLSSLRFLSVMLAVSVVTGCGDGGGNGYGNDYSGGINGDGSSVPTGYKLKWSDEFAAGSSVTANWNVETGYGPNNAGWGNDESQLYVNSADNLKIVTDPNDSANGMLSITARCDSDVWCVTPDGSAYTGTIPKRNGSITSAKVNTKGKLEIKYGNIQARIKVPDGKSTWPAFWMLGANYPNTPWPESGEIDIMEVHQAHSTINTANFAVHWNNGTAANPSAVYSTNNKVLSQPLSDDFHIYETEWNDKRIIGKIDGETYFTRTINPTTMDEFQKAFYLILNVGVDGTLGAEPDAIKTTPQEMLVDWVRVYELDKPLSYSLIRDDVGAAEDTLSHIRILDSGESGGNSVTTDLASTTVSPLQGSTVMKVDYASATESYSGAAFEYAAADVSAYNVLKFSVDTSNLTNFDDLSIEFVDTRNAGGSSTAGKQSVQLKSYLSAATGSWQSVEIPLKDFPNVSFDKIKLFGFWNPKDAAGNLISGVLYIDNVLLISDSSKDPAPVNVDIVPPAPVPTEAASDVIAIFSDAYTPITSVDYNPRWSQQTTYVTEAVANDDDVIRLINLDYQGIDFGANTQNLSGMSHLHVDFYTTNDITANTEFKIKLVDFGANGVYGDADGNEDSDNTSHELIFSANTVPALVSGNWVSFDIPLTYFSNMTDTTSVAQFVVADTGLNTVFLDNIYFYGNGSAGLAPADAPMAPTDAAADVISIYSDAYMDITGVDYNPDWGDSTTYSEESIASNNVIKLATINYQGIDFAGNKQNLSDYKTLHFDYWTPDVSTFKFFLISIDGSVTKEPSYEVSSTTAGSWQSVAVPLSSFTDLDLTKLAQIKIDAQADTSSGVLYLDNIYFSKIEIPTVPTTVPTAPTAVAASVLSVFSDAYTSITGVNVDPDWGQQTVATTETIAGNTVLKLAGLNYQGIDWVTDGAAIDVSGMTTLHLDYWTADSSNFEVYGISPGPKEKAQTVSVTTGSWQSVDLHLSDFVGTGSEEVDLSQLIQLKFEGSGTLYLDNIYFK